jgi:hypothetical protein
VTEKSHLVAAAVFEVVQVVGFAEVAGVVEAVEAWCWLFGFRLGKLSEVVEVELGGGIGLVEVEEEAFGG